jgi:hypothetical protein
MPDYLNEKQLARRWSMSHRTLQRWRRMGIGPDYLKLNRSVLYVLSDVENWERSRRRNVSTLRGGSDAPR